MTTKPTRTGPKIRRTRVKFPELRQTFEEKKYIYSCQYCNLRFIENKEYFLHISTNHQAQQKMATFQCNDCNIIFTKKTSLDLHCQTKHQRKSASRCDTCSVTFKSRYCLMRHLKLKQLLSQNPCLKCQKKFQNQEKLDKHMKNKHTFTHTTFQCDFCMLKFKMKSSLSIHLKRIHKKL